MINKIYKSSFFILFISVVVCQDDWHDGNMHGLNNFAINVIVDGLEGTVSSAWIKSKIIENLEEYKIRTSEEVAYPLLRILLVGESMVEVPGTYYTVEFSVIHHTVSIEEYSESFTNIEELTKFRTSKVYEHQSIGYSNNEYLRDRLLTALDDHLELFIGQWFADNPRHQF
ncbi:MAG TPA: hypothetical protein EYO13_01515 [Candidatus Marinimicrobia bacterium]|nr:hypothetical protein [Candidatus Neomarinimicrobiota bacterium]